MLPPQSPLLQPVLLLGHPCTRLGWARLPIPKIRFSQGALKDSPAHTQLMNNFSQVKVSTGLAKPRLAAPAHSNPEGAAGTLRMSSGATQDKGTGSREHTGEQRMRFLHDRS